MMFMRRFGVSCLLVLTCALSVVRTQDCNEVEAPTAADYASSNVNLYKGEQAFATRLLQSIQRSGSSENVFFSPHSVYHVLLLAYLGASGQTEQELAQVLQLDWAKNKSEVRDAYRGAKLHRAENAKSNLELFQSADRIYYSDSIQLTGCLGRALKEEFVPASFHSDPEGARQQINNFIANVTHDEIREMIRKGEIDTQTNAVLTNAAYFKGNWLRKFKPENTMRQPFYKSSNETTFVQMMHMKNDFRFNVDEALKAYILQIPFRTKPEQVKEEKADKMKHEKKPGANGDVDDYEDYDTDFSKVQTDEDLSDLSMVVLLPRFGADAINDLVAKLSPDTIKTTLESAVSRKVDLYLPKFEFEQRLELVETLKDLGLKSFFDGSSNFTEFSAANELSFGDVNHVAKIKVDEEGSTAVAATYAVSFRSARPIESPDFRCDHPFVFLIYEESSSSILFTGIYQGPAPKAKK